LLNKKNPEDKRRKADKNPDESQDSAAWPASWKKKRSVARREEKERKSPSTNRP
jgi:hypothetical protein